MDNMIIASKESKMHKDKLTPRPTSSPEYNSKTELRSPSGNLRLPKSEIWYPLGWHQQLVFVCENSWFFPHYFSMAEKFKYGSTHHPMRRRQSVCWGIANLNHIFYYYRKNCLSFSAQGHLKRRPQLFNSILCPAWLGSHRSTITETS